MTKTGYKFVTANMKSREGNITWKLGEWQKHEGNIVPCESGFHACQEPRDAFENYIYGDRFFIVEARGKIKKENDKFVASEMRLISEVDLKRVSVEWAIYCASLVLSIYEKEYPTDNRPRKAIEAAEKWLENPNEKNRIAAKAAAAAAWAAAGAAWASWATAAAAKAADAAAGAADTAAGAAWAGDAAAWAAAEGAAATAWAAEAAAAKAADAAWAAEKKQNTQLKKIIKKWVIE